MPRALRIAALLAPLALSLAPVTRAPISVAAADDVQVPDCIRVSQEAPYQGYGYTHIVVVRSQCDVAARCQVATDVDPEWQRVRVAAGATERVVTRRQAPGVAFQPRARCELASR